MIDRVEDYTDRFEPEIHAYRGFQPLRIAIQVAAQENERVRKGIADMESLPSLPMELIKKYSRVAVRHATLERYPDGWLATIHGFPGVWAKEHSEERTLEVLKEVVLDWTLLKIEHRDNDLPVIEEIDLNDVL